MRAIRGLLNYFTRTASRVVRSAARPFRARYDAAQTTEENAKHWSNADYLSANIENAPGVRRTLKNRARYEIANNSYAKGLISTLAHDLIGTGPRLALVLPDGFEKETATIESRWLEWCNRTGYVDKLRIMHESRIGDGEGFGLLINDDTVPPGAPCLDIRLLESDQFEDTLLRPYDATRVDGVKVDRNGKPLTYNVLRYHPGDMRGAVIGSNLADEIPARFVLHWFRPSRPGQVRGVPEITPVLGLFAQLRRYTLAVLTAAETAASIAGILKTDVPADPDAEPASVEAMDRVDIVRGSLLTLPPSWDAVTFPATQPVTTYEMFKAEILNEIGRCVNAPYNVVAGNSSKYNYSSGRLDHLIYHRTIWVERERLRFRVLDPVFTAWLAEALLIPGYLPAGLPHVSTWKWEYHWDGFLSIDPQKDAAANASNLTAGLTTLAELYAANGQDWKEALRQRAREIEFAKQLGLSGSAPPTPAPPAPPETPQ